MYPQLQVLTKSVSMSCQFVCSVRVEAVHTESLDFLKSKGYTTCSELHIKPGFGLDDVESAHRPLEGVKLAQTVEHEK